MLAPVRTVPPAVTPVSLDEAKDHLRVDHSDEDQLIERLIGVATSYLDGYTGILGRALITQSWRTDFGYFNQWRIPVGDFLAMTSVSYYDTLNTFQTLATSVYQVLTDAAGPYLTLKADQSWPSHYIRDDAVRLTWTAGYGPAASDVPTAIRHGILMMVGDFYRNRESNIIGASIAELPIAARHLIEPFRVRKI